jgi:hypothetical protein
MRSNNIDRVAIAKRTSCKKQSLLFLEAWLIADIRR